MTSTILAALILGTFAGMAPGPYTTMVVATGLERGFPAAARLALTPLVTDIGPLLATALLLDSLDSTALTVIGVVGGVVVVVVGVRFLAHHRHPVPDALDSPRIPPSGSRSDSAERAHPQSARFWHVATSALLSPAPWLFWLVIGSPLMLRSWHRSPWEGATFVVLLFATNIGTATTLAWMASHGRRAMAPRWRRSALLLAGLALSVAGVFLIWQALEGNFQALVDRQEDFRIFIEERTGGS